MKGRTAARPNSRAPPSPTPEVRSLGYLHIPGASLFRAIIGFFELFAPDRLSSALIAAQWCEAGITKIAFAIRAALLAMAKAGHLACVHLSRSYCARQQVEKQFVR